MMLSPVLVVFCYEYNPSLSTKHFLFAAHLPIRLHSRPYVQRHQMLFYYEIYRFIISGFFFSYHHKRYRPIAIYYFLFRYWSGLFSDYSGAYK